MASLLLRRSGVAVGQIAERLNNWQADLMVQVGVGLHHEEMEVLKHEWPDMLVHGFEAHPDIAKSVRKTYPGTIHSVALRDSVGSAPLFVKRRHKDGSSLFPHHIRGDEKYRSFMVDCSTLDSYQQEVYYDYDPLPKRVLLWLDCEGSELNVLRGGWNFLSHVDVVNVEMTAKPPGDGWCDPVEVHDLLRKRGFWLQWIHTQRNVNGQSDLVYVQSQLFNPDYCCCPVSIKEWRRSTCPEPK